ncbi:glycosyltransferase family 2 protein [Aeromonas veronii]
MNADIKVSVCVVTYNQEKFIAECLQSLVEQITDFPFEIIVGEDCSTDKTREIVIEFQKKYPNIIKPLLHVENVGPVENIIATYKQAKGTYIAHMDGDDLAMANKIAIQADILDRHPECFYCTHNASVIDSMSRVIRGNLSTEKTGIYDLRYLYKKLPFFTNSTKMFRNDLSDKIYSMLDNASIDVELHVYHAAKGAIYHLDDSLGMYRFLVGMSSEGSAVNKKIVDANRRIYSNALANGIHGLNSDALKEYYSRAILNFAYQSIYYGKRKDAISYARESLVIKKFGLLQYLILFGATIMPLTNIIAKLRHQMKR